MTKVDWFSVVARLLGLWLLIQTVSEAMTTFAGFLSWSPQTSSKEFIIPAVYFVFTLCVRLAIGAGLLLFGDRLAKRLYSV